MAIYVIGDLIAFSGLEEAFEVYNTAADATFAQKPIAVLILTTVIAGPLAEELIFRFMIFGRIRFYMGRGWAIIISSVLFGLYHGNMIQFIYCTIFGMMLSLLYDKSGNIWLPVVVHMATNMVGITAYF